MGVTIWSGLVQGAIFAIVACGFTVSQLPSGVFNFAQGALIVCGTYLTYFWYTSLGLSAVPAIVLNVLSGLALGVLCELTTVRPLRWSRIAHGGPSELVTTVGMATALIGAVGLLWGTLPLQVPWHGPNQVVSFLGIRALPVEITVVAGAIVVAVGLHAWFRFTRLGQACMAVSEDRNAAMLRGINVSALSLGAFAAAGALATLAATAIGPITFAVPTIGNTLALSGFVAIAIGGEGRFIGALIGGLLVGLVSSFAVRYLGANYSNLSILFILLVTLTIKPRGLGGAAEARVV